VGSVGLVILGAVIGAAATGGIQTWIASRQRRLDRKIAARAILGDLFMTEGLIRGVLEHQQWPMAFDGARPLETWKEFRRPFATAVCGDEWVEVDRIFSRLHQVVLASTLGEASAEPARPLLTDLLAALPRAQEIAAQFAADSADESRRSRLCWRSAEIRLRRRPRRSALRARRSGRPHRPTPSPAT
jgi:hypothetical protein